jgi:hypothetical protein
MNGVIQAGLTRMVPAHEFMPSDYQFPVCGSFWFTVYFHRALPFLLGNHGNPIVTGLN